MNIVSPSVTLIAHTTTIETPGMRRDDVSTHAEDLIEFAGRACYQSFGKPNPATKANRDYLQRTLFEQQHWSIAEHATATLYFEGVSRSFTHELIRHRHLSYSQLSQRFVDETGANIVLPPAVDENSAEALLLAESATKAIGAYTRLANTLTKDGLPRKQSREAARALLPNCVETRIVVTGNLRAWHEVIQRRTAPDADAEIQHVMQLAHEQLHHVSPTLFPTEG